MIALDFGLGAIEQEFWRVVFLMTRIGAALFAAPFFGAALVPVTVRVSAAWALAIFVAAWLPVAAPPALLSVDGLLAVEGDEVVLETLDPLKPATLKGTEHPEFLYLLMPVRIS